MEIEITHDASGRFFTLEKFVFGGRKRGHYQIVRGKKPDDREVWYRIPGTREYIPVSGCRDYNLHCVQMFLGNHTPLSAEQVADIYKQWCEYEV